MDFIIDLPPSRYRNAIVKNILVIVNRLSKKKRFLPYDGIIVEEIADLFYDNVWRYNGTPTSILTNRSTNFVSTFFRRLS